MVARTVLATLDGSAPHERLQVSLIQRQDGHLAIDLCEQHYAEGIGWFDQRKLALEPRQLRQITAALGMHSSGPVLADVEVPATLPFPGPRTIEPLRSAVGGEG